MCWVHGEGDSARGQGEVLKAQVFGATILPKVGPAEMEPRASPKSARAWREDAAHVVCCFISSLQSFGNPPV